jgi:hypothetical protein
MTHQLPPIVKLSERLLREIEQAVRGFARYNKYTLGSDRLRQSLLHRFTWLPVATRHRRFAPRMAHRVFTFDTGRTP